MLAVRVPDRDGQIGDVVLGFDRLADYESSDNPYFGATVGRVCNRIAGAAFELDGKHYALSANEGANHLHGGEQGFDAAWWSAERGADGVHFRYTSRAGEQGYPGTLEVLVSVRLPEDGVLQLDITATTDAPTLFAPTHHGYWNLAGHDAGSVAGHHLQLAASRYTPTDAALVPDGSFATVEGTALDFRSGMRVGQGLERLAEEGYDGYDHNLMLDGSGLRKVATLRDPGSGRVMHVETTEPAVQVYTANGLDVRGKGGATYGPHTGICLETQHPPDAIHHPRFPSVVLRPGERFSTTTRFVFVTDRD